MRLALIAHDGKKDDMIALAADFLPLLRRCELIATGTTGTRLAQAHGLAVERMLSGPMGGDLQIGARRALRNQRGHRAAAAGPLERGLTARGSPPT